MSLANQASNSTSTTPPAIGSEVTIDLRVADARWKHRQLQARVQHARQRLEELEAGHHGTGAVFESPLGDRLVEAQNRIARERADARRTALALMADAELESRRRLDVARAEAQALLVMARWLRSQGGALSDDGSMVLADAEAEGT